eukprot:4397644-Pleurochrysis_carterae.AAC.1
MGVLRSGGAHYAKARVCAHVQRAHVHFGISARIQSGAQAHVLRLLEKYNIVECRELHCVWDFKEWLEPHLHPIRGFATGQFGDGMHEFILRKDSAGIVRVYFRKSSQASTWQPEGLGYEVFKSQQNVVPPLASLKPDDKWKKSTVDGTVRQWLKHFALTC